MVPHLTKVEKRVSETVALKDKLATLKRAKASEANIESCREELALVEKAQREAQAKAAAIDAATFDLKAVNPEPGLYEIRAPFLKFLQPSNSRG